MTPHIPPSCVARTWPGRATVGKRTSSSRSSSFEVVAGSWISTAARILSPPLSSRFLVNPALRRSYRLLLS